MKLKLYGYEIDEFTQAYIECALWSSNDESDESGGKPLNQNYGFEDLALETVEAMVKVCREFQENNRVLLDQIDYRSSQWSTDTLAGHDFWLTRNHHGAGFWDRGLGKLGDLLTEESQRYGECDLYIGDDGRIYSYGK